MTRHSLFQNTSKGKNGNLIDKIENNIYIYRYDFFAIVIMLIFIFFYLRTFLLDGHIVFSDLDFPYSSERYIEEIFGIWNGRWSTPTMLNLPRLFYILPSFLIGKLFNGSGEIMLKIFMFQIVILSALSMYLFAKRLVSIYFGSHFNFFKVFSLITGSLFYAVNPWVIFRIQHIYLLCGYSLFPLIILYYFKVFNIKFQKQVINGFSPYNTKLYKQNIIDIFILAYLITVASAAIHYFFYTVGFFIILTMLLILEYTIIHMKYGWTRVYKIYLNFIKKIVLFSVFLIGLSFYWLVIYFASIVLGIQASQHNINALDTFLQFSKYSNLKNIVFLISYWWPMFDLGKLGIQFYIGGSIILSFVFLGIITQTRKTHILAFFTFLAMGVIFMSTGVTYDRITPYFLILNKLPVVGSMFRDPNKLVGILTFLYSIFIIFGLEYVNDRYKFNKFSYILKGGLIIIVLVGFSLYLEPFKVNYIDQFLKPLEQPKAYVELEEYQKNNPLRSLYLPIADQMVHKEGKVATPYWNLDKNSDLRYKATGDIQIYNSIDNTIFHHEGSSSNIGYYINFMQHLLDEGKSFYIGELASQFGVGRIIYHSDYLTQEKRQAFNEAILQLQNKLKLTYKNEIIRIFDIDTEVANGKLIRNKIFTPYGLSSLVKILDFKSNTLDLYPVIFTNSQLGVLFKHIKTGDYIEVKDKNDILMSSFEKNDFLYPFDWINEANPFLKWSKTYLSNIDWKWYMQTMSIPYIKYEFDMDKGVAVSFASAKLDVLPQDRDQIEGKLVADFDTLLRLDKFFVPDNPQIFSVVANPFTEYNNLPTLRGVVQSGDPKNIWQVAKSGYLKAKEKTPYQFNLVVSGRGTNQLHVKVRFFNKNMEEIGVSYVVAPEETIDFEGINFIGEYITPSDTAFMRLDLLTFQRPEQKTYWWIHNIEIYDLTSYKAKNIVEGNYHVDYKADNEVYIRVFKSKNGGNVNLKIDDEMFAINTYEEKCAEFKWIYLGNMNLNQGDHRVSLENGRGFNVVNSILIKPKEIIENQNKKLDHAFRKSKIFCFLEGEEDFKYDGFIQTKRNYLGLSQGQGLAVQNGKVWQDIDIVKNSKYSILMKLKYGNEKGIVKLNIYDENGKLIVNEIINRKNSVNNLFLPKIVDYDDQDKNYVWSLENAMYLRLDYKTWQLNNINLKKGKYKIEIIIDSQIASIVNLEKFEKNNLNFLNFSKAMIFGDKEIEFNCGSINEDMMNEIKIENGYRYEFQPTKSTDWYTYASPLIDVSPNEELVIKFDAISKNLVKRHEEFIFVDKNNKWLDTVQINEVEEYKKIEDNHYEQIIKVPQNATKVGIQFKARGSNEIGNMDITNFELYRYDQNIILDKVEIIEGDFDSFFDEYEIQDIDIKKIDTMKYVLDANNIGSTDYVNFFQSYSPAWSISPSLGESLAFNGITNGYEANGISNFIIKIKLRKVYYLGLLIHFLTWIIFIIIYRKGR